MRQIGIIPNRDLAQKFSDFLCTKNLGHKIEIEDNNQNFSVWIENDADIPQAKEFLQSFLQNPQNTIFQNLHSTATKIRKKEVLDEKTARDLQIDYRTYMHKQRTVSLGKVTLFLMIISVITSLFSIPGNFEKIQFFFIVEIQKNNGSFFFRPGLYEVLHEWQFWRVFTPMFIHFDILHILFNMLWLKDLGSVIEKRKGPTLYILLVLTLAATSNVSQYFVSGPFFGGMSGVVYGLFGYLWMKTKFDPKFGYILNKQIVTLMIVWFFICLAGLVGPIANTAHGVGLAVGMMWGYIGSPHFKKIFKG